VATDVIGSAYIEVVPRGFEKFNAAAKAGVQPALAGVESSVRRTATNVGTSFQAAGKQAGTALKPVSAGIKKVDEDAKNSSNHIKKYFRDAGTEIQSSFGKIAAGTIVGVAIFDFFKSSAKAASDFNETASKTKVVFGEAAPAVEKFAATAATSLGQSTQQAEDAVSTFGNLLEGLKIAPKLAATMSIQLDKLASDFASFHNANPADVIEALTAAFRGEFDPVQKFVPTINAATVSMEAMKETGKKNANSLTLQEKGLATYNILLKNAGPALGDFARTSGGAANQSRILAAQFDNLKVRVGQVLLPAMTSILRVTNTVITALLNAGHTVQTFGAPIVTVFHAVGSALGEVGQHKTALIGVGVAVASFIVISKGLTITRAIFSSIFGRGGVLDGIRARALYAAEGVGNLGTSMSGAAGKAVAFNAIIGIAAIGIGIWAAHQAEAKAKVAAHSDAVHALADALRESNGLITENVRASVAQRLEQDGILKTVEHVGIATSTYTDAVLGNKSAIDQVSAALRDYTGSGKDNTLTTIHNVDAVASQVNLYGEAAQANQRVTTATQGTTTATTNNTTATKAAAAAMEAEKEKAEKLREALENLANVNLDAESAHLQFQAAIISVDTSLKGLDKTTKAQTLSLNGNTAAGNAARQTLISNVKAAIADYDAQLKRGVGIGKATQTLNADIAALRLHYHQLGFSDQAVNQIIASLGRFGRQHPVATVTVNTKQAEVKIGGVEHELTKLNGRIVSVFIKGEVTGSAKNILIGVPQGAFAHGGVVGQSTGRRERTDTQLVWASLGEGMIVPKAVAALGGPAGIARLNAGQLPLALPHSGSGNGGGTSLVISPNAVQLSFTVGEHDGSWAHSKEEVEDIITRVFADLLMKLRVGGTRR
jgi:hypothetical protein